MPNYHDNMNNYSKKKYTGWLKPFHLFGSDDKIAYSGNMQTLEFDPNS